MTEHGLIGMDLWQVSKIGMRQKKKLRKPSELLKLYSRALNQGIEERFSPLAFELSFSYRSPRVAHISGYAVFRNGWILEFDEVLKQEGLVVAKDKYRYHVMDQNKELIFRYDNVAHFPKLKTYPHHKHLSQTVVESTAPDLLQVIEEIEKSIIYPKTKTI